MVITMKSDKTNWFFGTQPADGVASSTEHDFVTVALHEFMHGLGFITGARETDSGTPPYEYQLSGLPIIYDVFVQNSSEEELQTIPLTGTVLETFLQSDDLFWNGAQAKSANIDVFPKLYAPTTWNAGSSIGHLNQATTGTTDPFFGTTPNRLMVPQVALGPGVHILGPLALEC